MSEVKIDTRKVWFVDFPTYRYEQNVKELAAEKRLRVLDSKFKGTIKDDMVCKDEPKLTLKEEYKPKKGK